MSEPIRWDLPGPGDDNTWDIAASVSQGVHIIIPMGQIDGASDEDIGKHVRWLHTEMGSVLAYMIAEDLIEAGTAALDAPNYPWHRTMLANYAKSDAVIDRAYRLCLEAEDHERFRHVASNRQKRQNQRAGFVYLMKAGPYYKIGRSVAVDKRLTQLAIQLPERPELMCSFATSDMVESERRLHQMFGHKRLNGEWFSLDDQDVGRIRSLFGA